MSANKNKYEQLRKTVDTECWRVPNEILYLDEIGAHEKLVLSWLFKHVKSFPGRGITARSIADTLKLRPNSVKGYLDTLVKHGMITMSNSFIGENGAEVKFDKPRVSGINPCSSWTGVKQQWKKKNIVAKKNTSLEETKNTEETEEEVVDVDPLEAMLGYKGHYFVAPASLLESENDALVKMGVMCLLSWEEGSNPGLERLACVVKTSRKATIKRGLSPRAMFADEIKATSHQRARDVMTDAKAAGLISFETPKHSGKSKKGNDKQSHDYTHYTLNVEAILGLDSVTDDGDSVTNDGDSVTNDGVFVTGGGRSNLVKNNPNNPVDVEVEGNSSSSGSKCGEAASPSHPLPEKKAAPQKGTSSHPHFTPEEIEADRREEEARVAAKRDAPNTLHPELSDLLAEALGKCDDGFPS